MRKLDGTDDDLFGYLLGAGLDHHDAVPGADDHDVQLADQALRVGRVHAVLPVDEADAHSTNWAVERNVRERQGAACAIDAEHVGIVFLVG